MLCLIVLADGTSVGVPWISTALVSLLASQQFFATGHQATIAGIQWTAAFHGFREDHTTVWLPALLVSLNTFASHILCTLSLPLLVYWPFTRGRWMANQREKAVTQDKGEFVLNVQGGEEVRSHVYLLIVRFMLLSALKVTAANVLFVFMSVVYVNQEICSYPTAILNNVMLYLLSKFINHNLADSATPVKQKFIGILF